MFFFRKIGRFPILLLILFILCIASAATCLAENYPESKHPYDRYSDITWEYMHPDKPYALRLRFSENTMISSACTSNDQGDYLEITGSDGIARRYSDFDFDQDFYIIGDTVKLRLVTGSLYNAYGFRVSEIEAVTREEYEANTRPEFLIDASGTITDYFGQVSNVVIPEEINGIKVTAIGNSAFHQNEHVKWISIPYGTRSIGRSAFDACTNLTEIDIPETVTSIGYRAFHQCDSMEEIVLPENLTEIGNNTFQNCRHLTHISIPSRVVSIGASAFENCYELASVELPDSLQTIGALAFNYCTKLASVALPDSLQTIGSSAFSGNTILCFGNNPAFEEFALENNLQYISDNRQLVSGDIDNYQQKVEWIVRNYTSASMSEYKKALRLYNWLCANVQYDYQDYYYNIPTGPHGSANEGALLDGWAVCWGYSLAYRDLLEEAGITAYVVNGFVDNVPHAWNIAEINGNYYQFDATWEGGGNGSAHNYFALCDAAMRYNHTQNTHLSLVCRSYEANYKYRNGKYDAALESIRERINASIIAENYAGTIECPEVSWWSSDPYTVACIVSDWSDWPVNGWAELVPDYENRRFIFDFHADENQLISLEIVGDLDFENIPWLSGYAFYTGASGSITVKTEPANISVSFASSDESIFSVNQQGEFRIMEEGKAILTVTADNHSISRTIYVDNSSITLKCNPSTSMDLNETIQVVPAFIGNLYEVPEFLSTEGRWTSSDSSVATVDSSGAVRPVGYGKTTISASLGDSFTACIDISVRKPVTGILLDKKLYESTVDADLVVDYRVDGCDQDSFFRDFSIVPISSDNQSIARCRGSGSYGKGEDGYIRYFHKIACYQPGVVTLHLEAPDGSGATADCELVIHSNSSIHLPSDLKEIEDQAFTGMDATEFILPEGITSIGSKAFENCINLRLINLPQSLKSISDDAFNGCSDITLLVKKDTMAHTFAERMSIEYLIMD